jgi:hypothetical protein
MRTIRDHLTYHARRHLSTPKVYLLNSFHTLIHKRTFPRNIRDIPHLILGTHPVLQSLSMRRIPARGLIRAVQLRYRITLMAILKGNSKAPRHIRLSQELQVLVTGQHRCPKGVEKVIQPGPIR